MVFDTELVLPGLKYRRRIIVWSHVALSIMKNRCRFQSIRILGTTSKLGEESEVGNLKFVSDQLCESFSNFPKA